jgi:hypothetical protein
MSLRLWWILGGILCKEDAVVGEGIFIVICCCFSIAKLG